jgi:hypothetical protein
LIDYTSIAYAIAAIVGMIFYIWNSWPSNEAFNPQKAFNTVIRGGAISILTSAVALAPFGLNIGLIGIAFMMGFTFDAGLKKASDSFVTKPNQ